MKHTALSPCAAVPACRTTAHRSLPARLKQLTLSTLVALTLGSLAANAQNLIVNGSFETGDLAGWTTINNTPGGPYSVYPVAAHYAEGASDGTYSALFNSGNTQPVAALAQTFATVPGVQYTLSFDYGTYTDGPPFPQSLIVEVSSSSLPPQLTTSVQSGFFNPTFTTFTYTFTATDTSSTLTFSDFPANFTSSEDGILDNISLVAATPPADPLLSPDLQAQTVFSKTYTTTGANSKVYGNVLAGGVSTIGASGLVSGDLVSGGAANLGGLGTSGRNATVTGSISSGGVLTTGDSAVVGGNITSSGASTVGANSQTGGNLVSDGAATTGGSSIVRGNIATGGAASIGATASVGGEVAAVGAITVSADSTVGSQSTLSSSPIDPTAYTAAINSRGSDGASSVVTAQNALTAMGTGTVLAPTITTDTTLVSGVYSAASLSTTAGTTLYLDGQGLDNQYWVFNITDILATGASTRIEIINAGSNSGVIWNVGGYASLGASSTFIGTILANTYISVGANTSVSGVGSSCGGLYSATSYVSTGDGAIIGGSGCANTGSGFSIDANGTAFFKGAPSEPAPL